MRALLLATLLSTMPILAFAGSYNDVELNLDNISTGTKTTVEQDGNANRARVTLKENEFSPVTIRQVGDRNFGEIVNYDNVNTQTITQTGNDNSASLSTNKQLYNNVTSTAVVQNGNGNSISARDVYSLRSNFTQNGDGNSINASNLGYTSYNYNDNHVLQEGSGNYVAAANGNSLFLEQRGNGNYMRATGQALRAKQKGDRNYLDVSASGDALTDTVVQEGNANSMAAKVGYSKFYAKQIGGDRNSMSVEGDRAFGDYLLTQNGTANSMRVTNDSGGSNLGSALTLNTEQTGDSNAIQARLQRQSANLQIQQVGNSNYVNYDAKDNAYVNSKIVQKGNGNYAKQVLTNVSGDPVFRDETTNYPLQSIYQEGDYNTAIQDVQGQSNSVRIRQTGNQNYAEETINGNNNAYDINQVGNQNHGVLAMAGNGNTLSLNQQGTGHSYAINGVGNGLSMNITQK